jgi:hypothetical protein
MMARYGQHTWSESRLADSFAIQADLYHRCRLHKIFLLKIYLISADLTQDGSIDHSPFSKGANI